MTGEGAELEVALLEAKAVPMQGPVKPIPFRDALRLQESFTARAERKVLVWLA